MPKSVRDKRETDKAFKKLMESVRGETYDFIVGGDTDSIYIVGDAHIGTRGLHADLIILDELEYVVNNDTMTVIEIFGMPGHGRSEVELERIIGFQEYERERRNAGEVEADITYVP